MSVAVTATFVFTDLVDSTATAARLGPEAAEELRQTHFGLLRGAVTASGGAEVKNLGDGLMLMYSSPRSALACAVDMQQAIEEHNRAAAEPLGVRIGISAGEAIEEDDDFFGDPVVEAARLCSIGGGGEILATDIVRMLAGARAGFDFEPRGPVELKGFEEPVNSVCVRWSPRPLRASVAVPLPSRLGAAQGHLFVGRTDERARLREIFKAVVEGERRAVLIAGEPGIGKTTLTGNLAVEAYEQGAVVLYGRCDEELRIPYQPWAEALAPLVSNIPSELLSRHVNAYGGAVARLAPRLTERVEGSTFSTQADGEQLRYELFGAVAALLSEVAALVPMVIVLDDLHWADMPTLLLLRHIVGHSLSDRLLFVGTYRHSDITDGHPLSDALVALRRESGAERMLLGGLDDHETVALLEAAAGVDLDETAIALAHAVYEETDGNPFFTLEVLQHLIESRVLVSQPDGRWIATQDLAEVGLPDSAREVVGQRVHRLGDATHRVLSYAAVIGRDFGLALLSAACERSEEEVLELLDAAVAAGVVSEASESFSFAHGLFQHSLYEGLGATRRRQAHLRVAQALEDLCGADPGPRVGELARHWAAASVPVNSNKAIDYAAQAGWRALDVLAPDDAVRWFTEALGLHTQQNMSDVARECDLLIGLGIAQRQSGNPDHRATLLNAAALARSLPDADLLARAALANNAGRREHTTSPDIDAERVDTLRAALELLRKDDSPVRAELLATLAAELAAYNRTDWPERYEIALDAVAMARRVGDEGTLVRVIARAFHAINCPHTHRLRGEHVAEALAATAYRPDPGLRALALDRAIWWSLDAGELEHVDDYLAEQLPLVDRLGEATLRFGAALAWVTRAMVVAAPDQVQALLDELLEIGAQYGAPDATTSWGTLASTLAMRRGQFADIAPLIEMAVGDNPDIPAAKAALAAIYCNLEQNDEAQRLFDGQRRDGFTDLPRDRTWMPAVIAWARTAVRLGARDAVRTLYDELAPFADLHSTALYGGAEGTLHADLGFLAGALGQYEDSERHFTQAADESRRLGATYWLASCELDHARILRAHGQPDDQVRATALLEDVLKIARGDGYRYLEDQASAFRG